MIVSAKPADGSACQRRFEDGGYRVSLVKGGGEALDWLLKNPTPSAIVFIGAMTPMGGWDALMIARAYHRFVCVPVVIVSDEPIASMAGTGFTYLDKSATSDTVFDTVRQILTPLGRAVTR